MVKQGELYCPERFPRLTKRAVIICDPFNHSFSMYLPINCFHREVSYYSVGVQGLVANFGTLVNPGPRVMKSLVSHSPHTQHPTHWLVRINQEKSPSRPLLPSSPFVIPSWNDEGCSAEGGGQSNSRLLDTLGLCKPADCTGSSGNLTFHWKSSSLPPGCQCELLHCRQSL